MGDRHVCQYTAIDIELLAYLHRFAQTGHGRACLQGLSEIAFSQPVRSTINKIEHNCGKRQV